MIGKGGKTVSSLKLTCDVFSRLCRDFNCSGYPMTLRHQHYYCQAVLPITVAVCARPGGVDSSLVSGLFSGCVDFPCA